MSKTTKKKKKGEDVPYFTEDMLKERARKRLAEENAREAKIVKSAQRSKAENYWYHYKWHTIAGAFVLLLAVFFIRDMIFTTKPDATIVVVTGETYLAQEQLDSIAATLEQYATDFNGDKKVKIQLDHIYMGSLATQADAEDVDEAEDAGMDIAAMMGGSGDAQMEYASSMKLMTVIAAATDPVYLLDASAYAYITRDSMEEDGTVVAADPYEIFRPLAIAGATDNALDLSATVLPELAGLPEDSGLCFYVRAGDRFEKDAGYMQYCLDLLEAITKDAAVTNGGVQLEQ